jgi:hypothetical protein
LIKYDNSLDLDEHDKKIRQQYRKEFKDFIVDGIQRRYSK